MINLSFVCCVRVRHRQQIDRLEQRIYANYPAKVVVATYSVMSLSEIRAQFKHQRWINLAYSLQSNSIHVVRYSD